MRFRKLILRNFAAFESLDLTFPQFPVRVVGRNLTDKGQENNGSGKSLIFDGLDFAIRGKFFRKVTNKKMIRRGCKRLDTELLIDCSMRNKTLHIERSLTKSGSTLEIWETALYNDKCDKAKTSFSTVDDGNEFILNWMDFTSKDLFNYYLINELGFKSFLSSSDTDVLKIIDRISGTEQLQTATENVKRDLQQKKEELAKIHNEKSSIVGRLDEKNREIDIESIRDYEAEKAERVNSIRAAMKKCENDILTKEFLLADSEKSISSISAKIGDLNNQLSSIIPENKEAISSSKELIKSIEEVSDEAIGQKVLLSNDIAAKQISISGHIECPKCKHSFVKGDRSVNIEEVRLDIAGKTSERGSVVNLIDECSVHINEERANLKCLEKDLVLSRSINSSIKSLKNDIQSHIDTQNRALNGIDEELKVIERYKQVIAEVLKGGGEDYRLISLKNRKEELELCLVKVNERVDDKEDEIYQSEQWETNFKKFRLHISKKALLIIQSTVNNSLEMVKSDMRCAISGFKKLDKKTVEKISIKILRDDEEIDLGSFSKGERARIEMSFILAMKKIKDSQNKYGGLDFLIVDEKFDGIDGLGYSLIMEAVKDCNYPILVISHVTDERLTNHETMEVLKEDDKSKCRIL